MTDFIYIENINIDCNYYINFFEENKDSIQLRDYENKKDESVVMSFRNVPQKVYDLQNIIWYNVDNYRKKFCSTTSLGNLTNSCIKIQKTIPGTGYHLWHCEHSAVHPNRVLAWIIYLNDIEEGGETEFLYQSKRVSPKAGTILIFPASHTHTHRGNPPLKKDKYILTGWIDAF